MPVLLNSDYYDLASMVEAFPEFRDFRVIAESEKGAVFDVHSINRGFRVALKLAADRGDPGTRQRFDKEFEILFANQHYARLLRIYGDHGGRWLTMKNGSTVQHFFFTMKLCLSDVGRALDARVLDLCSRVIGIIQMLDGLNCLHTKDIAHRDIKPGNLFLELLKSDDAEYPAHPIAVKLGDFDIAKVSGRMDGSRTYHPIGTLYYLAPERWREDAPVHTDWRPSDQYAAGATAFQMLSQGNLPLDFKGLNDKEALSSFRDVHATGSKQALIIPERVQRHGPQRFPRLEQVLYRMMAVNPADRYENILKCKLALLDALAASGIWPCNHGA